MATAHTAHKHTAPPPFYVLPCFHFSSCKLSVLTQTKLASDLETTSGPSMSCQSFLPVSLHRAEAEGLTSTPWSVDSSEQCEEHEESLCLFCVDDLEPLCERCAAMSHAGHRVYLLAEAATDCKVRIRYQALQLWHFNCIENTNSTTDVVVWDLERSTKAEVNECVV